MTAGWNRPDCWRGATSPSMRPGSGCATTATDRPAGVVRIGEAGAAWVTRTPDLRITKDYFSVLARTAAYTGALVH